MEYELKQNPAPNEWAVLMWKRVDGRKELASCAVFSGEFANQLASDYRDLAVALQAKLAQIIMAKR